jgi:hypothetical protein
MRWEGHIAFMEEKNNSYRILVRKPESKTSVGRPTLIWEDIIKTDIREIEWGGVD